MVKVQQGTGLKYDTSDSDLPLIFKSGVMINSNPNGNHNFVTAIDFLIINNEQYYLNTGFEYQLYKTIFFRAGYKLNYDVDSFTTGLGIKIYNFVIDYSLGNKGVLGDVHNVTFTIKW